MGGLGRHRDLPVMFTASGTFRRLPHDKSSEEIEIRSVSASHDLSLFLFRQAVTSYSCDKGLQIGDTHDITQEMIEKKNHHG